MSTDAANPFTTPNKNLRLWYRKPAVDWNEALPFGNGRLGGMVFGTIPAEHIQLNEDSIWYGGPRNRNNPDAKKNLNKIRKLIMDGRIREAEKLAVLAFSGTPESQRHYQPLGDLTLTFDNHNGEVSHYERDLDLESAVISVHYELDGVRYSRQVFSSAIDQVVVIRLSAGKPSMIAVTIRLERERLLDRVIASDNNTLTMIGFCGGKEGIGFSASLRAISEKGNVETVGDNLVIKEADDVMLILAAQTSFRHQDYEQQSIRDIEKASKKAFAGLQEVHIADYMQLFKRVTLQLEDKVNLCSMPTDQRLERLKDGFDDPALVALYFQFGRYLLISSSRPGTLPANLQGIWNKDFHPPWGSKYTININTQMNYWPAEACNLPECHLPLFELLERMREHGRQTAKEMYGCRGFTAHHNTDIWADTAPQDIWIPATYWPMGAAWLCLHFWEHYLFNPEPDFLKRAYPVMKEAAEFFLDFLIEDEKGRLITCPTVSPENTYRLETGESGSLCPGCAMDSQILFQLFDALIKASIALNEDSAFRDLLHQTIKKLPLPQVGKHGQIQEWLEDYEEVEPGHRHISQLFGLHPGNQFNKKDTPQLLEAARRTLERRLQYGGGHTGWSRAWIINLWARLENPAKAYENVLELLRRSTHPNLFDTHPPFQIDGNFGGTAGIAEMLVQSHTGEINILPALPQSWNTGYAGGLRARGGYIIDIAWRMGKLEKIKLKAGYSGPVRLGYGLRYVNLMLEAQQEVVLDESSFIR